MIKSCYQNNFSKNERKQTNNELKYVIPLFVVLHSCSFVSYFAVEA